MTTASENLPDPKRIIIPLRLIFWGIIICIPYIEINHINPNVVIGTLLILWGVVLLSRVSVSDQYQRGMVFTVGAAFATICSLYTVLSYLILVTSPGCLPDAVYVLAVIGMFVFLFCMREYCSVMNWERVVASWRYSIRLMICVGIACVLLAIPIAAIIPTLEFHPKNPPPIEWTISSADGGFQYTGKRNGEIIYTSEIIPSGERFEPPNLSPSQSDGWVFDVGEWFALVEDEVQGGVLMLLGVSLFALVFWTLIHILMSLSRMIRAAQRTNTLYALSQLSASLTALHLRIWKVRRQRYQQPPFG